jgi:U3 small nucleolar RNA-associated protein 12
MPECCVTCCRFSSRYAQILISSITLQVELICRVCVVLLQTHHNQLTTTPVARSVLTELKEILYGMVKVNNFQSSRSTDRHLAAVWSFPCLTFILQDCKDTIGFNLAAMDHTKVRCHLSLFFNISANLDLKFEVCSTFWWPLIWRVTSFQELLAMRSDAPFRDAKAKLMEIRQEQSKRSDRSAGGDNKRKKKTKASTQSWSLG